MNKSPLKLLLPWLIVTLLLSKSVSACALDVNDRSYQKYFAWIALDGIGAGRAGRIVIDTGAEGSIIAPFMAPAEARLEPRQMTAPTGSFAAKILAGTAAALSVEGKSLQLSEPVVVDLPQAPGQPPLLAFIGQDILSHCVISLDQQQRRISIKSKPTETPAGPYFAMPLVGERKLYHAQIEMAGARLFALIDTGTAEELALSGDIARWFRATTANKPSTSYPTGSFAGPRMAQIVTVDAMKLGALDFSRVEVLGVTDSDLRSPVTATLGLGIFQCHRLTLDFPGQRAWADPIPGCNRPILTRSGLLMRVDERGAVASFIMANSPAATSGLKVGDAICSINGQIVEVNYASSTLANWSRAPAGTRV